MHYFNDDAVPMRHFKKFDQKCFAMKAHKGNIDYRFESGPSLINQGPLETDIYWNRQFLTTATHIHTHTHS